MMEGALKVSTSKVRDIMIPRPQIVFVSSDEDSKEFLPRVIKSRHSRFPVINNETEEVEGLLLAKDLLPLLSRENNENLNLKNLLRPASLVPEGKKLNILLDEFRAKRNHMAIVIDEYGDITGLVTIEDVLEEIVGEIEDEHDDLQDTMIKQVSNNEYLVSALIPIKEFNEEFGSSLEDSEFDTLGGIVMHHFSRFPKINDAISIGDLRFIIASTSKKRIKQIKVLK
jgi:magnesium and cobalt transporter